MTISPNKYPTEIFGHHGFSRVYPENTLIGFQKAIGLGVDGIELDIVVNKDLDLVISQEPYMEGKWYRRKKIVENSYKWDNYWLPKFNVG